MPQRIQLSRAKGWRKPEGAFVVSRPSRWGNPFPVPRYGLLLSLNLYELMVHGIFDPGLLEDLDDAEFKTAYGL